MALYLIWAAVIVGCAVGRISEWRLHRRNYQWLRNAGASEKYAQLCQFYYVLTLLVLPVAIAEQVLFGAQVTRPLLLLGLGAVLLGQGLRGWAIRSLGPLWSMRCLAAPGLRHRAVGPYRWLENPEYLSRVIDSAGLALVFGAKLTLVAFVLALLLLNRRLVVAERAQMDAVEAAEPHLDLPDAIS